MKLNYTWTFRMGGGQPKGWRERLAHVVRKFASLIDGRYPVPLVMESTPKISAGKKDDCLIAGAKLASKLFEDEVKTEAIEQAIKKLMPELFDT